MEKKEDLKKPTRNRSKRTKLDVKKKESHYFLRKRKVKETKKKPQNKKRNQKTKKEKKTEVPPIDLPNRNCIICFNELENEAFTNTCWHSFCFRCLMKWKKEKIQCPLCKQEFSKIITNAKSNFAYEEYDINTRTITKHFGLNFRHPVIETATSSSYYSWFDGSEIPSTFRKNIYDKCEFVVPFPNGTRLQLSPEYYRRNPFGKRRLLRFLKRELAILLEQESYYTSLLKLIMYLSERFEITSREFSISIKPFLGKKTKQFIHELNNYVTSPFDLDDYDQNAKYWPMEYSCITDSDDDKNDYSHDVDTDSDDDDLSIYNGFSLPRQYLPEFAIRKLKRVKALYLKRNKKNSSKLQ